MMSPGKSKVRIVVGLFMNESYDRKIDRTSYSASSPESQRRSENEGAAQRGLANTSKPMEVRPGQWTVL
jgi:hypothetical protein